MRDFVDRFNRCVGKIPQACQPNEGNQLCVFIATLQTEIKFLLKRKKIQSLRDAQKEAIEVDDDMLLSGMKCIEKSVMKVPKSEICFHDQNFKPIEKFQQRRLILKAAKPTPPISFHQNLTVFNDEDFCPCLMAENISHNIAGIYHLHVEDDDAHGSKLENLMACVDAFPFEKRLDSERSNGSLSEEFSFSDFETFTFDTFDIVLASGLDQENMEKQDESQMHVGEKVGGIPHLDE